MTKKAIIGKSPWIDLAIDEWRHQIPDLEIRRLDLDLDQSYGYESSRFLEIDPLIETGFVAWGPEFLNFQRYELFGEMKKLGIKLPPLIHTSSAISPSAVIQENVWISPMVIVGPNTTIETNAKINARTTIGFSCKISRSVWIGNNTNIGSNVEIGANCYLGDNVTVKTGVCIGKQCRLEIPELIESNIFERTFALNTPEKSRGRVFWYD